MCLWDTKTLFHFFFSLPLVRKVPKRVQILFFRIAQVICLLVLSKFAFALGYVLMEDLNRAVAQFYPSSSGGMSGGSSTPPGPSGDSAFLPFASPHLNETGVKAEASGHTVAHPTAENPLQTYKRILQDHDAVADLVQQIHRDLHTTVPGGFQAERLSEMLQELHGTEKMTEIRQSLETQGAQSPYFREVQVLFRTLRDSGGTEMQLRKEWQGRASV